jgi:hypothetical protein
VIGGLGTSAAWPGRSSCGRPICRIVSAAETTSGGVVCKLRAKSASRGSSSICPVAAISRSNFSFTSGVAGWARLGVLAGGSNKASDMMSAPIELR